MIAVASYNIRAEDRNLLVCKNGILGTEGEENPVKFIPLDGRNAILIPSGNLEIWNEAAKAIVFGYDEDAHKAGALMVKYVQRSDGSIYILGWRPRLYYRTALGPEADKSRMTQMAAAPEAGCKFSVERCAPVKDEIRTDLGNLIRFLHTRDYAGINFCALTRYSIELFFQVLPQEKLEPKIREFLAQDGIMWLRRFFPEDKIANYGFNSDADVRSRLMNEEYDFLEDIWLKFNPGSTPQIVNQVYRKLKAPDRRACVVTTARNEGPYIIEFIAYYKALGFDEIFVYSNDNTDGSDFLLKLLADAGQIYYLENRIGPDATAHARGYIHAVTLNYELPRFKWALVADVDEFLYINPALFTGLSDFLDFHESLGTESISFNWLHVGSNGKMAWENRLVLERFPYCQPNPDVNIKSMYRTALAGSMQSHFPIPVYGHNMVYRNSCGARYTNTNFSAYHKYALAFSDVRTNSHAAMLHYIYKSFDEFIFKMGRNTGARKITRDICFEILDTYRMQRFITQFDVKPGSLILIDAALLTKTKEYMQKLRSVPGVADAEKSSIDRFMSLLPKYKREFIRHIEANPDLKSSYQLLMDGAGKREGYSLLADI